MKNSQNLSQKLVYFTAILGLVALIYVVGYIFSFWDEIYYKEFSLSPLKHRENSSIEEGSDSKVKNALSRSKNGYSLFFKSILCSIKTFSFKGPFLGTLWQILYLPKRILLFLIKVPLRILHHFKYLLCQIKRGKFVKLIFCDVKRFIIGIWKLLYFIKLKIIRLICIYCNIMQPTSSSLYYDDSDKCDAYYLTSDDEETLNQPEVDEDDEEPCVKVIKKKIYITKEVPVYKYVEATNCPKPETITKVEYKDVYDEMDAETTNRLRTLISDILTKQKELDTMLSNTEKEIKEIKNVIETLKPSVSKDDISNILNSLSTMDVDIDKIVDEALTSINEKLKEVSMKEREVHLSYNGNIFTDSPLLINTRDIKHITIKFDHPAFVTRIVFDQTVADEKLGYAKSNDIISDITIHLISRGYQLTSSSMKLEQQNSIALEKPVLCDSIIIEINDHKGEGENSVIPLLHVFESPL